MAEEISHRIASRLWHTLIQFYSQGTKGSRNALFVMEKKLRVVEKASTEKAARILQRLIPLKRNLRQQERCPRETISNKSSMLYKYKFIGKETLN